MRLSQVVAGAAISLSLSLGAVEAAPIAGSVAINFGNVSDGGGPLTTVSTLNVSNAQFNSPGTGNLLILAGSPINDFSVDLTLGSPVVFSGPGGSYDGAVSEVTFLFGGEFANVVSVSGIFTPDPTFEAPVGSFPFASLDPNPETRVNLTFTFIPSASGAGSYAGSGVMRAEEFTIPNLVPEPMSLGLFGLGLAGLGLAMRRRGGVARLS